MLNKSFKDFDALGIITKFASKPENKGLEQDDILRRVERFALQSVACKFLNRRVSRSNYSSFFHRVNYCLKRRIDVNKPVSVYYNEKRQKAHYHNLQRCGSVWTCPVCSAQITELRRLELMSAMENWKKKGGAVYLLTLTNRHHCGDDLVSLLAGQKKAIKYFWSDRVSKEKFRSLGKVGHIIATEVTYGENGWHPHYHVLLFFEKSIDYKNLSNFLSSCWINCCRKSKLALPSSEHGVDIRDGTYAHQYVSKWGLECEMTKGHTKKGREGGLTPFDLLRESVEMPEYGRLFSVFADAFKGKKQLVWSKGLKFKLGVLERSDDDLAKQTEGISVEVKQLSADIWHLIVFYDMRVKYLEVIEQDMLDDGSRAYNFVIRLARHYVDNHLKKNQLE